MQPMSPAGAATPAPQSAAISPRTRAVLQAPILPTLLRLAVPSVLVTLVTALSSTVGAVFVSRLGPDALAGGSLVFPVWMLMTTMSAGGFGGGVASAVARALGGGRRADADALVGQALLMAVILAVPFTVVPLAAGPAIYGAFGGTDRVLSLALAYSNVVFAAALLIWLMQTLSSVLRGSGEMAFTAVVTVGGEILHLM